MPRFSRFLLATLCLALPAALIAQTTIESFGVGKKRDFLQSSTALPTSQVIPGDPVGPYHFSAEMTGTNLNQLAPAPKVQLPNSTQYTLAGDSASVEITGNYTTKGALDAAFPNSSGAYTFTGGIYSLPISLGAGDLYPADIPQVTNGTWNQQGALVIDPVSFQTLNFASFSNYLSGAGGLITFEIYKLSGNTPTDVLVSVQRTALTGFQTDPILSAYTIGPFVLPANQVYYAELSYTRVANLNTNFVLSIGAVGVATFTHTTGFMISTAPPDAGPSFTVNPENHATFGGTATTFTATATGSPAPTYQWQRLPAGSSTWANLAETGIYTGTATALLTLSAPTVGMNGDQFRCVATNVIGSTTSPAGTLTVYPVIPLAITQQPVSQAVAPGGSVTFSVTAVGSGPLLYRWTSSTSGYNYPLGYNSTLTVSNVQATELGGYHVTVTDAFGSVTSQAATLSFAAVSSSGVVSVHAGIGSTLFVKSDGSLWGQGGNGWGELGDGTFEMRRTPILIANGVAMASHFYQHTLYIKSDRTLWAMGTTGFGLLGDGSYVSTSPVQIATDVVSAAAGQNFSLFIKADGTLWSVGYNINGQLGDGTGVDRASPVQIATDVVAASAGRHGLFIKADGTLWGMGRNDNYQLGDGTATNRSSPVLIAQNVVAASAGMSHSLFITTDGTLWSMGSNSWGQLGDGTFWTARPPAAIASDVATASAGTEHSLFVKKDGTLWGMGYNGSYQLGNGVGSRSTTPVLIATGVVSASAGGAHSTFVTTDGILKGMGKNAIGQLGAGTIDSYYSSPVALVQGSLTVPAAPVGVLAAAVFSPQRILVNWNPTPAATSYEVWRHTTNDPAAATRIASNVPSALFFDATANPGATYYYWAKAVNLAGASAFSDSARASGQSFAADFNADGKPDLIWSNSLTGERALWLMNGPLFLGASTLGIFPLEWTVAATGDFNFDGKPDLVWSNSLTGERALWLMNGTTLLGVSTLGVFPLEWTVAATGDFNADGKPDLVWSNSLTGERALWLMNGTQFIAASTLGVFPLEWTVAATGDFNFDGKPDLVWSNSLTGERALWLMNGTNLLGVSTLGIFPLEWTVRGTADFNADGKPDLIWSNSLTGERALWLMNGTQFLAASTLGVFPLEWTVGN